MYQTARNRALSAEAQRVFHRALSPRRPPPLRPTRRYHRTPHACMPPSSSGPPKSRDRGPPSTEETQTDFAELNIFAAMPPPTTGIDACMDDGFALNSGLKVTGAGVLLVGGEAFRWRPWIRAGGKEGTMGAGEDEDEGVRGVGGTLLDARGRWDVDARAWGILDLAWPKPDLLVVGTGRGIVPLSPETRRRVAALGVRVEVLDTRNAAAQFNLLATERGVQQVAAALVPIGWREGKR